MKVKYTEYDIHGKGVPKLHHAEKLEAVLKRLTPKSVYDRLEKTVRRGNPNPNASHPVNASLTELSDLDVIELLPTLKKCFPTLRFRISGKFIYGPGDSIDEHTNSNDPSNTLYITYATGESKFSYRHSLDEDLIDTYDVTNGITIRAFEITAREPYTYHKVECKSGYRVSIGLRYVEV